MRKLRIGIIDIVANSPNRTYYARAMRANLASIMGQVIAVWCEEEGHDVSLAYYSGYQNMIEDLPGNLDAVFIGAFTTSAHVAYALSNKFRSEGVVTILGGPHATAYPMDAINYFDFVVGFTDKQVVRDILADCTHHHPGVYLSALQQPESLPGVRQRWPYIERLLREAPLIKIVPMISSLGCPYSCSFCVDSVVKYQELDHESIKKDLRFLLTKMKQPRVAWHDPNFGIRFDDIMTTIEEAVPPGSMGFIAESSLSLLSEENVKRLQKNGFKAILPGIESWFDMGNKSKTGRAYGVDKVELVAEQVNMILKYIPYLQANFVLGLDADEGGAPFELTKKFIDMAPGAFPAYSMLTAFGRSAPLNLEYQKQGRVLPFPFQFLNNSGAMNVKPKNYTWIDFFDKMTALFEYSFSNKSIFRRFIANKGWIPKTMNVLRATSSEGWAKINYLKQIRRQLNENKEFSNFYDQKTTELPEYFVNKVKNTLGPLREWLPDGAVTHDHYAYLKWEQERSDDA